MLFLSPVFHVILLANSSFSGFRTLARRNFPAQRVPFDALRRSMCPHSSEWPSHKLVSGRKVFIWKFNLQTSRCAKTRKWIFVRRAVAAAATAAPRIVSLEMCLHSFRSRCLCAWVSRTPVELKHSQSRSVRLFPPPTSVRTHAPVNSTTGPLQIGSFIRQIELCPSGHRNESR